MFVVVASTQDEHIAAIGQRWSSDGEYRDAVLHLSPYCIAKIVGSSAYRSVGSQHMMGSARIADFEEEFGLSIARPARDIASLLARHQAGGIAALTQVSGSYAVVMWDDALRCLSATRDALGIQPLYYRRIGQSIELSDSLDGFEPKGSFDLEFLVSFIATGRPSSTRTVWSDITPVESGTTLLWSGGSITQQRYWAPAAIREIEGASEGELVERFRQLFERAVVDEIRCDGETWAELSGGHDSSAVCCVAAEYSARCSAPGLGGTVTYVDTIGGGDESRYAQTVVTRYGLPNLRITNPLPWADDGRPPHPSPQPIRDYPFYARDRYIAATLNKFNARVLLSGAGPDLYLPRITHVADLVWTGRIRDGLQDLLEWCEFSRQSVWRALSHDVIVPILPVSAQAWYHGRQTTYPSWLRRDFVDRSGLVSRFVERRVAHSWPGQILKRNIARRLSDLGTVLNGHRNMPDVEYRHPCLYRPLVEFCLALPRALRTNARHPKPVLRAAMRGIVPDEILARRTKGTAVSPRVRLGLRKRESLIAQLLAEPILAELGCVEPEPMRAAAREAASGSGPDNQFLYYALSLETWLSARTNRAICWSDDASDVMSA